MKVPFLVLLLVLQKVIGSLALCNNTQVELPWGALRGVFLTTTMGLAHWDMLLWIILATSKFLSLVSGSHDV